MCQADFSIRSSDLRDEQGKDETMTRVVLLSAATLVALIHQVAAGPCSVDIDKLQARVNAQLDATASGGQFGAESVDAKLHHQPTPSSIAGAEERLGEGIDVRKALAGLRYARDLDQAGQEAGCHNALFAAQRALGP
jgi:hypothetical protein